MEPFDWHWYQISRPLKYLFRVGSYWLAFILLSCSHANPSIDISLQGIHRNLSLRFNKGNCMRAINPYFSVTSLQSTYNCVISLPSEMSINWNQLSDRTSQTSLWGCSFLILLLLNTSCPVLANSVDPDQLASEEATDLDLHCLPVNMWISIKNSDQVIWLAGN